MGDAEIEEQTYSDAYRMEGVKLIEKGQEDGRQARSMTQESYTLHSNARLILRWEGMHGALRRININSNNPLYLSMSSDDFIDNKNTYEAVIKVCPITKTWMMLATWNRSHPFPTASSNWSSPGGDFME